MKVWVNITKINSVSQAFRVTCCKRSDSGVRLTSLCAVPTIWTPGTGYFQGGGGGVKVAPKKKNKPTPKFLKTLRFQLMIRYLNFKRFILGRGSRTNQSKGIIFDNLSSGPRIISEKESVVLFLLFKTKSKRKRCFNKPWDRLTGD